MRTCGRCENMSGFPRIGFPERMWKSTQPTVECSVHRWVSGGMSKMFYGVNVRVEMPDVKIGEKWQNDDFYL